MCVFFIAFCVRMKAVQAKEATSRTTRGGTHRLQNLPVSAGTYAIIAVFGQFVFLDQCSRVDKRIKAAERQLALPAVQPDRVSTLAF